MVVFVVSASIYTKDSAESLDIMLKSKLMNGF